MSNEQHFHEGRLQSVRLRLVIASFAAGALDQYYAAPATVPPCHVGHCAHTGNETVTVREENTILGRRSPYAIRPLSCLFVCLSVTLVYCGQTV